MRLWCVHGNLQTTEVWQQVGDRWWESLSTRTVKLELVDLWASEAADFQQWTKELRLQVENRLQPGEPQWLMGYSLGGRLALHALLDSPQLWAGGIAIAADPGIKAREGQARARERCLQRDLGWGQRFLTEPWERLLRDWDRQSVFTGYACSLNRTEVAFDRYRIRQLFDRFSKGRQADLRTALAQHHRPPILFVSGEHDRKYVTIGSELEDTCECITHTIVPTAGHRVPWENPSGFIEAVKQFVQSINM